MKDKSDRELLVLSAKAIGYQTSHRWNRDRMNMDPQIIALVVCDSDGELICTGWNPLADDGHALGLGVMLHMDIAVNYTNTVVETVTGLAQIVGHGNDPAAATRKAIVLAAASIGEAMP